MERFILKHLLAWQSQENRLQLVVRGARVTSIEYITGKKIIPGKTWLFIDEIQESANAIKALRYFKEKMPQLHIIAAGSLLEFTMKDANFSMPVGRIQ